MRTTPDRIRHALSFEIIGLALVAPLGAWLFGLSIEDSGAVALGSAVVAALWTYLYNLGFDLALRRMAGHTRKSWRARVLHAGLYEVSMIAILAPLIAWYLNVGLLVAAMMDLTLALFFAVYAFLFNLAYDHLFPAPDAIPAER